MREILFKAKRLDNGEWVEGDLFHNDNSYYPMTLIGSLVLSRNKYTDEIDIDGYGLIEVDPETVCQYTGLKDMNGKKIFEGDILKGYVYPFFCDGEHNYYAEVVWFDDSPAFGIYTFKNPLSAVRGISAGNTEYLEEFESNSWEVIGNIFDNPELLEVTE